MEKGSRDRQAHELDILCFSLCLPVDGDMHSGRGVLATRESFGAYRSALAAILAG